MLKKGFKQFLAEANAEIEIVSVTEGQGLLGDPDAVIVDVREAHERQQGYIPGSIHASRGFLEFVADPEGPMHNPLLTPDKRVVVYCGTGGRSALAAKTLMDMGFSRAASLAGGIQAWQAAGGEIAS
jgi:rhodanese-related sulfurtransferase